MFDIELEFTRCGLLDKIGTAISHGEISLDEVIDFFIKTFFDSTCGLHGHSVLQDDSFPDFAAMETEKPIYPLEDFPATPEDMMKLIRETNSIPGCDIMSAEEAVEIL